MSDSLLSEKKIIGLCHLHKKSILYIFGSLYVGNLILSNKHYVLRAKLNLLQD